MTTGLVNTYTHESETLGPSILSMHCALCAMLRQSLAIVCTSDAVCAKPLWAACVVLSVYFVLGILYVFYVLNFMCDAQTGMQCWQAGLYYDCTC